LNAIAQARARLEKRQRETELDKGREPVDKPRGGRCKREFGVPEDEAQDNFTDPDSRIMMRAGGGFDASDNAQTAVDETARIIVAAELTHSASDAAQLPRMLQAVRLQTAEAKDAYRRRKWIAEPPNGWIKSVLGFRQFSMRGSHRVSAEWKLVCMALNLRRMATLSGDERSGAPSSC
jgi:hypothetical protein